MLPGSVLPAGAEALSGHVQKKGVHGENGEKNDSDTLDGEDMDPGEARDRPYTPRFLLRRLFIVTAAVQRLPLISRPIDQVQNLFRMAFRICLPIRFRPLFWGDGTV
ncbi:MAG: hypothetical protein R3D26_18815 [Cyanobacteriota/Melainabacteria group bacterium]